MSSDDKTPDLREALSEMTEPPAEVFGTRIITSLDDPRLSSLGGSEEAAEAAHAPTDPAPADPAPAGLKVEELGVSALEDDAMPAVLGTEGSPLPPSDDAQEAGEVAVVEPLPPPPPAPLPPLPSHRVDFVPADLDLEALPENVRFAILARVDFSEGSERPGCELRRFDELRLDPEDVNTLLGLGVRLVLMPHLPLPADIMIADMHAHEHADPHVPVLLVVPPDSHPELLERVAAENANRELVAASNREQARIAAENAAREAAEREEQRLAAEAEAAAKKAAEKN